MGVWNKTNNIRPSTFGAEKPWWLNYTVTIVIQITLIYFLGSISYVLPLKNYTFINIIFPMLIAYIFGPGTAILSGVISWASFTYYCVPPLYAFWQLAETKKEWAAQILFILSVITVIAVTIQAKASRRRIQVLVDETVRLNEQLNKELDEHKQTEANLQDILAKLDQAQELAKTGFWNLDLADMKLEWSKGLKLIFELDPDDPTPTREDFFEYVFQDDIDFVKEQFKKQLMLTNKSTVSYVYRIITKNGNIKYLEHIGRQIFNNETKLIGIYGSTQDITERKQAENALLQSETQMRILVNTIPDLIWLKDMDGIYLSCNPTFERFFGAKEKDIVGKTDYDFVDKALADFFRDNDHKAIEAGKPNTNEEWLTFAETGYHGLFETIKTPMIDANGNLIGVLGISRDITERMNAEKALFENEAAIRNKLKAILEPEGDISTLNLSDIIDSESLQSIMEEFYNITGIPSAILDIPGKVLVAVGWQDICTKFHRCHPETLKNCLESDTILTSGVPMGTTKVYRCKNNMWDVVTPIEVGGKHVGNVFIGQFFYEDEKPDIELFRSQAQRYGFNEEEYLAALKRVPQWSKEKANSALIYTAKLTKIISNLSYSSIRLSRALAESKRTEEELQQERIFTEAIYESMPGLLYLYDDSGNLIRWNSKHEEITGYTAEELSHMTLDKWFSEEDVKKVKAAVEEIFKTGYGEVEADLITKKGKKIHILSNGVPLNIAGKPYFTGVAIDITERRQMEEKLRRLNLELEERVTQRTKQLEASNKELEAFSYSASHDLRAPLRAIDGFSNAIFNSYYDSLDERGKDYLQRIRAAVQRMGELIDHLLNLSRVTRTELRRKSVNLTTIATDILSELQKSMPLRKADFIVNPDMIVNADENLLRIALDNLLGNAWKFTGKRETTSIEVGVTEQNNEHIFYVKDNGAGFNPDYAEKMFSPFQRMHSESEFPGTGIGLALVDRIIRKHRGNIWAESNVDNGATFYFTFGEETK